MCYYGRNVNQSFSWKYDHIPTKTCVHICTLTVVCQCQRLKGEIIMMSPFSSLTEDLAVVDKTTSLPQPGATSVDKVDSMTTLDIATTLRQGLHTLTLACPLKGKRWAATGEMISCSPLLTHWGRDKWTPFRRRHFQMHFLEWKCINLP